MQLPTLSILSGLAALVAIPHPAGAINAAHAALLARQVPGTTTTKPVATTTTRPTTAAVATTPTSSAATTPASSASSAPKTAPPKSCPASPCLVAVVGYIEAIDPRFCDKFVKKQCKKPSKLGHFADQAILNACGCVQSRPKPSTTLSTARSTTTSPAATNTGYTPGNGGFDDSDTSYSPWTYSDDAAGPTATGLIAHAGNYAPFRSSPNAFAIVDHSGASPHVMRLCQTVTLQQNQEYDADVWAWLQADQDHMPNVQLAFTLGDNESPAYTVPNDSTYHEYIRAFQYSGPPGPVTICVQISAGSGAGADGGYTLALDDFELGNPQEKK